MRGQGRVVLVSFGLEIVWGGKQQRERRCGEEEGVRKEKRRRRDVKRDKASRNIEDWCVWV